jgi:hypothetical protein
LEEGGGNGLLLVVILARDLIDAIRAFPVRREVEHCGARITVDSLDFYANCTHCGVRIKVRSFAAIPEIEDVFDAVFEWMNREGAQEFADHRRAALPPRSEKLAPR